MTGYGTPGHIVLFDAWIKKLSIGATYALLHRNTLSPHLHSSGHEFMFLELIQKQKIQHSYRSDCVLLHTFKSNFRMGFMMSETTVCLSLSYSFSLSHSQLGIWREEWSEDRGKEAVQTVPVHHPRQADLSRAAASQTHEARERKSNLWTGGLSPARPTKAAGLFTQYLLLKYEYIYISARSRHVDLLALLTPHL